MNRLAFGVVGAVLVALMVIVFIPVPKPSPDFSRAPTAVDVATPNPPIAALASADPVFRDTRWHELTPRDWDPYKQFRGMQAGIRLMPDTDPNGPAMLKKVREVWDNAPINSAMAGAAIRIPGYVVPLDETRGGLKAFLLVPYFGACIHSPPPPSNQIVHVVAISPMKGLRSMDAVWVSGTLHAVRSESHMGASSYGMSAVKVEPYTVAQRTP